ncbi:MAG TPA: LLM class flavin-dependent oxidoreductase [Thermomicrobiales bacterium]|nr:LLM class flavin-dependent oxidoreductase [Thermomicrobiales bacterium]
MARHPWVAKADDGVRWGMQVVVPARRDALPKLMDVARQMEALGFDSLFVMDHPALHADPYIALSGAAAVTEKLHLGQLVMAATYRHPAFVARMQADLDNLSGGRSVLGVGSGWFEAEYGMMDIPFPAIGRRQKDLDELIACVDGLWSGQPFTHHGETFTIEGMQIDPAPARRPPVLVGGSGKKGTLRQVATWADACNVEEELKLNTSGATDAQRFEQVGEIFAALDGHLDDLGRSRNEVLKSHFTTMLVLGPTQEAADQRAAQIDTSKSTSAGARARGRKFLASSSVDRAVAYYRGLRKAGAQYFVVQVNMDDQETMQLLADAVMPNVE